MNEFIHAYIQSALWTGHRESDDEPDGSNLTEFDADDIEDVTLQEMKEDCRQFWEAHKDDIEDDPSQAGHDFNLTRNRHGCGFWDGDWPTDAAKRLTEASHVWGTFQLVLYGEWSDENKITHHN